MGRFSVVVAIGLVGLTGCVLEDSDNACIEPAFAIQVNLSIPFDVGEQGVVLHWADQSPSDGVAAPAGYSNTALRRSFLTRAEAAAFEGPFVVRVGGVERGRATMAFSDCDRVADIGQDPADRRQAVFAYSLDFDGSLEGGGNSYAGIDCVASAGPPITYQVPELPCPLSERRLMYRFALEGPLVPTRVLVDGVEVAPYSISPSDRGAYFSVHLVSPLGAPVSSVQHDLAIEQDGVRSAIYDARFQPCIGAASDEDIDPDSLVYQRLHLDLVDGVLEVDDWSGYDCGTVSGTSFGAVP